MIRFENRFDEYAYRVATLPLGDNVKVEGGRWITIKGGKIVIANKTDAKAFMAIGSNREGRDQVAGKFIKNISFLVGDFMVTVDTFDKTKTYGDMTPLTAVDGVLAPAGENETVLAYCLGAPKNGFIRIVNA